MGPFRCFNGALGGLTGLWKAWMVTQEARMGEQRPRWDIGVSQKSHTKALEAPCRGIDVA